MLSLGAHTGLYAAKIICVLPDNFWPLLLVNKVQKQMLNNAQKKWCSKMLNIHVEPRKHRILLSLVFSIGFNK